MGKAEGRDTNWHGHITAVSVAPEFRRMKLAATFMENLENISERWGWRIAFSKNHFIYRLKCYFVDLFVRVSNTTAFKIYSNFGYVVYRRILDYYSGDDGEDAYGRNIFVSSSITNVQICRHEKGAFARRRQKIDDCDQGARELRRHRIGNVVGLILSRINAITICNFCSCFCKIVVFILKSF